MAERCHGYNVSVGYSAHFLREVAPDWMRFCIRAHGFDVPKTSGSYRYLDLGCGPGFHLCLLAATNPQAEFVGVDFQGEHIAHAQELSAAAGLTNVRFVQGDFLDLARAWPDDLGAFDYIAVYGILSWVSPDIRAAAFNCVAQASKPGTVAAFAYNTPPGWLRAVPFQHVANRLAKTHEAEAAIDSAVTMFRRLIDVKAPVSQQFPAFKPLLEVLSAQPRNYLIHELLTDHWTPLWHSRVAGELRATDFHYVGSASVAEALLPNSLPPELRAFVLEQEDTSFRQDVQDIVINQQLRRDLFCRLPGPPTQGDLDGEALVYLFSPPREGVPVHFQTSFGNLTVDYSVVADIVAAVAGAPKPVAELLELSSPVPRHTRSMLLLMLEANILMLGADVPGSAEIAQRFNAVVARSVAEGRPYQYLAAANLGSGVAATELDLLLLDTWLSANSSNDQAAMAAGLTERLQRLGRALNFQGAPVADDQLHSRAEHIAKVFIDQVVPRWRTIGVMQ